MKSILFSPLHYYVDLAGGAEAAKASKILKIAASRYQVFAYAGFIKDSLPPRVFTNSGRSTFERPLNSWQRLVFMWRCYQWSLKIIKDHQIDLVHHLAPFSLDYNFNFLPLLAQIKETPFIVGPVQLARPSSDYVKNAHLYLPLSRIFSRKTLSNCRLVIAINHQTKSFIKEILPDSGVEVIPTSVDTSIFYPKKSPADNQKKTFDIVFVGRFVALKRVNFLIEIFKRLAVALPDWPLRLHLVGQGELEEEIRRKVESFGPKISSQVVFHGQLDSLGIAELFRNCEIFLTVSRSESFSQALAEAMACGLCCLSTSNFGALDLLNNNRGILLPKAISLEEEGTVVGRVVEVIKNPNLRRSLGSRASDYVNLFLSDDYVRHQYLNLYQSLIG